MCTLLVGVSLTGCKPSGTGEAASSAESQRCGALKGTKLGFGTVDDVDHVTKGEELVELSKRLFVKTVLSLELPPVPAPRSFCRVAASLTPVSRSLIKVQVWLPDEWNEKMLASGGGGFNGGLFSASLSMREGATKGYATVVTDVGHDVSDSAKFAYENKEALIDYGYRGNHSTAVFTKDLIANYYGKPAKLAYFQGGSNGGREALMEARRFPQDYDGIIAGMPAMSFTKLMAGFLWNTQAIAAAAGLKSKVGLVREAVLKKCDALDGVSDGMLENPPSCAFDPAELQCRGSDAADCLTAAEVEALRKIHSGPQLRDGTSVFPGLAVGSETHPTEMDFWIVGDKAAQPGMGQEFFRWMVHGDPKWERAQFDIDRDYPAAAKLASILDSDDPDLTEFLQRGGKLIIHHGWNDNAIPAASTLNYYDALLKKVGALAEQQVRLFMVPGMGHGTGRPGPEHYDLLSELERWVEQGDAPNEIVARQFVAAPPPFTGPEPDAKVARTLLLCAWPKVASYSGSGSTDDRANFSCK
jgi:feruloyl esterase